MLGLLLAAPGVATVWRIVSAVVSFLVNCKPCLIAIAIGVAWIAGDIHGHHKENAEWSEKWKAAEAKAEHDRQARDAFAKATIEADANNRLAGLSTRATELQAKVDKYEHDEELRRATGGGAAALDSCVTDSSDDKWLRDIQRKRRTGAGARGGLAERLRSNFTGSPAARKP